MPSIQDLRNHYSVLDENNFSDEEVVKWVSDQTGETPQEVASYLTPAEPQEAYDPYAAYAAATGLSGNSDGYESEETSGVRDVADVATGLVSGTAKAAGALVGIGSLVPGLHYVADPLSAWLQEAGEGIDEALLSDRQKEINQELSNRLKDAAGELGPDASVGDYFDAMVSQGGEAGSFVADHPGQVANLIATSVPYIFGGGAATKGIKAGAEALGVKKVAEMGGITGAAVGEGAITSGEVTKNIIEQTGTSGDYSSNRLAAVPAGLGTAGISLASGRMANRAGVTDVDVAVTNKITGESTNLIDQAAKKGLAANAKDVAKGAAFEGGEELLQGAQEKVFENLGTGEHLLSDVGGEAVIGAFAGAGQGAGINTIKAVTARDEISEASKEAQAAIIAEQEQALEDDTFIQEAMAISNTEENVAFGQRWAEKLGVSEDEVFNDPRFGVAKENLEVIKQEEATKDLRFKHRDTFPDEKDWNKEHEAELEQNQKADISNPDSDLGAAFVAWSKENDVYDTNDQTVEDFLADPAIMDMVLEGNVDEGRGPYLAALDAHANFKENEAARTEEEVALAAATTSALLDEYNQALAEGDLLAAGAVEQTAKTKLDPAEWSIAKRGNVAPKKGKKPGTQAKGLGEGTTPVGKPKGATPTPEMANPYREGTIKAAAYEEAVEALGDIAAYPEISKSIDSKKGVYGKGETPFQRVLAKAKLKKRLADLSDVEQSKEGGTKAETAVATDNLAKKLASAVASGDIELTNTQVKVLDVVLDAIENDNLGDYFYGDSKTGSAKLAEAAGLKGRSTADSAIKSIRGYFTDAAGEGTKDQLKKTKFRGVGGVPIGEAPGSEGAASAASTAIDAPEDTNRDYTGEPTDDMESFDARGNDEEASNLEIAFGTGAGVIKDGGSQTNISSLNKEEAAWVDKKVEAKAKKEDSARMSKARKEQDALVSRITSDKELNKQVSDTWEENKPENAGSFGDMSTHAKFLWINAVAESMETGNVDVLSADASEINEKFSGKQDKGATANGKTKSEPKTKTEEVRKGQREDNKKPAGDGAAANKRGEKGTETPRKGKPKVTYKSTTKKPKVTVKKPQKPKVTVKKPQKPKVTVKKPQKPKRSDSGASKAAQKAMDYADEKLGDNWPTDHPVLMRILASRKFAAFTKKVDSVALHYNKTKESLGARGTGATQKAFDKILNDMFNGNVPEKARERIHYYNTLEDFESDNKFPGAKVTDASVEGIHYKGNVVFILDNIEKGQEMSSFMHEVGSHIGMDGLMNANDLVKMADLIMGWDNGKQKTDARTKRIAGSAVDGVSFAMERYEETHGVSMPKEQVRQELVAYFIEDAVRDGVAPSPTTKVGKALSDVVASFRKALNKFFEFTGKGGVVLSMQDVVDLAYGAAKYGLENTATNTSNNTKESINKNKSKQDVSRTRKVIKALAGDTGIQHWDTFSNAMKRASNETKFLHQFIEENKVKMPGASVFFDLILRAEETVNKIKRHVEGVAVQAREMSEERLAVVNKFIADSTLNRAWGYDPKFKGKKIKVDSEMSKRFLSLEPSEQQLVKDIFAHGEAMIQRKRAIAKAKGVNDAFFNTGALDGPYAPLKRFGNYVTVLKSKALLNAEKAYELRSNKVNERRLNNLRAKEAHLVVKFFDTIGAANRFRDENSGNYESATATESKNSTSAERAPNHKVLSKVLGSMKASNIDPASYKAMEALVQEMYMNSLDESNARESQAKREGIAGFEPNMVRSFLSHSRAEANLISQMEHGADIAAALVDAEQETKADPEELVPVYNMIVSHYTAMLEGKENSIVNRVAAFNTVWMLTSSVGYHFTNATQPLMVTVPVLAATFGDYKGTMKALLPMFGYGYQVARDVVTFKKQNDKFFHRQAEIDFDKLDPKYVELFKKLQDRKLLDVGLEQDLAEFTRMDTGSASLNKISGTAGDVTHRLYQAARVVEMYNRVSTAVAAHDMAAKNPSKIKHTGMTPTEFAVKIVQDTQGDFSNTDAPRIIKRLPKLLVQYRKYQFMMGWVYANAAKAAWAGSTTEEKAVGYKTLGYMLMHAGLFGGVRGLPFIGAVAGAFALFSGGEEPEDIERIIGRYIEDEELASLISRGLPSILGIDMSTKLSQDKIFHPAPFVDLELSQEGLRDAFFGTFLGPTANTASSMVRAGEYASEGNAYRSIETAMPKGIKTIMESWRVGTEGYQLRNGDIVADPSQFNKIALIANALGIPSSDLSKIKWTRGQQFELQEYFSKAQSDIRKQYIKADKAGDYDKLTELEERFDALQDDKDRVRPFFNDNYGSLKRTSIRSLLMAPIKQGTREEKYRRELGAD